MANKSTTGQKHPYHLVDPSPLPFLSSIAGLAMAAGLVFYMHYGTSWLLILGTIGLLTIMFLWWRDVIKESWLLQPLFSYCGHFACVAEFLQPGIVMHAQLDPLHLGERAISLRPQ